MSRNVQSWAIPWAMILGCAALVLAAMLLPAFIMRPAARVDPGNKVIPQRPFPVANHSGMPSEQARAAPTTATTAGERPVAVPTAQTTAGLAPSAQTSAPQTPTTQPPVANSPTAAAPSAQTTAGQAPSSQTSATQTPTAQPPVTNPPAAPLTSTQAAPAAPPAASPPSAPPPAAQAAPRPRSSQRTARRPAAPAAEPPAANPSPGESAPVQTQTAQTPATQTPPTQAAPTPPAQAPSSALTSALSTSVEESGDGLSRGQAFALIEKEALKKLSPEEVLTSALMRGFSFPSSRVDAVFGVDVSHHNAANCQCVINWEKVADQKVAFVFAKASEGIRFRDPQFKAHWDSLGKISRIHRGAYHFLTADDDPEQQAAYFLATIGPLQANDLPPVLDLEWDVFDRPSRKWAKRDNDYWSGLDPDQIIDRVLKWLTIVEAKTGRTPIIYTSREWWAQRIKDESKIERLSRYGLWLASYANKDLQVEKPNVNRKQGGKWTDWVLWQFTNMGDLSSAGIRNASTSSAERWDVNIYAGSIEEFRKEMGITATVGPIAENKPNPDANKPDNTQGPPADPPKEKQATVTPGPDSSKPGDDNIPKPPGAGDATPPPADPPKEKQATVTPGPDGTKPDDPNAPKAPGSGDASPPPDRPKDSQQPSVPGADKNKPSDIAKTPDVPAPPSEQSKGPQVAAGPNVDKPSKDGPPKPPASPAWDRDMVEILLPNGRLLRVNQNIAPDVLSRLVDVLDRQ